MSDPVMHPDELRRIGALLFGEEWQRAMARALGPHHPDGPREAIDDAMVRKWARGARSVPAWARPALAIIGRDQIASLRARVDDLRTAVEEIER